MNETSNVIPFAKVDKIMARLPGGSGQRMDRVLRGGELRSKPIRDTLLAEIQRREEERK